MEKLNANNLKNILWETLNGIKEGTIEAGKGDAIASQSREILRTVNTQVKISQVSGRPLPLDVLSFGENTPS